MLGWKSLFVFVFSENILIVNVTVIYHALTG